MYTIEQFKEKIEYIRSCIPDISISTDVIAGFVQESDEEFEIVIKEIERKIIELKESIDQL